MRKSLIIISMTLLLWQTDTFAQLAEFGTVAEGLQNSAHNLFYNSSGPYYNQNNAGNTGFNYWWNSHSIDAFMDGYLRTRNTTYLTRSKNLLRGIKVKNGNTYNNTFIDDMEWLAISCLRAYDITKDAEYLSVAEELWGYIKNNGFRGNYFQWNTSCPECGNTCSNTPAVIFAARLYRLKGNAADLQIARDVFAWVKSTLVDPANGGVWDNYNVNTGAISTARFSYNQGTYIGAALELYQVTSDLTYMNDAVKTADYAISNNTNGILYANAGGGDGGLFNGILVRYLALLAREGNIAQAKKAAYNSMMLTSARALKNQGINYTNYTASPMWGTAPANGQTDYSSQLSAVMLAEVASTFDQVGVYQDINYGGNYAHLSPGSYTLAQLQANGIADNYITALTIPAGYQVTAYENDNFTGASTVYTSSQAWIGSWNDRISSLVITRPVTAITLFNDCSYTGTSISLPAGDYTLAQLQAFGYTDNQLSSFTLESGYQAILYAKDNFTGTAYTATASDNCLVNENLNDSTTSLRVQPTSSFNRLIEAESYSSMAGVQTETCSEGTLNVGYIETGDWMAYNSITIPTTGTYLVEYRVASQSGGGRLSLDVNAGATILGYLDIPSTNGWQNWTTASHTVSITAGTYNFGIYAQTGGWNINWWRITQQSSAVSARTAVADIVTAAEEKTNSFLYPNPTYGSIRLTYTGKHASLAIYDAMGHEVVPAMAIQSGKAVDISQLDKGLYLVQVEIDGVRRTERIIRK